MWGPRALEAWRWGRQTSGGWSGWGRQALITVAWASAHVLLNGEGEPRESLSPEGPATG